MNKLKKINLKGGDMHSDVYITAALSTVAKLWKEPKCPLTDEWIEYM